MVEMEKDVALSEHLCLQVEVQVDQVEEPVKVEEPIKVEDPTKVEETVKEEAVAKVEVSIKVEEVEEQM